MHLGHTTHRLRQAIAALGLLALGSTLASGAIAAEESKEWTAEWRDGVRIERADGDFKIRFNGRTYIDWAVIGQSDSLHRAVGGTGNGVEIRSARLGMSGSLYKRLIFKSDFDFAGGDVDMKDVFVGIKNIPGVGTLKVGHFKEPFGFEEMNSSRHIVFMERSMLQIFYPVRNVGLMANNTAFDQRMTWAVGVYRPADDAGNGFGSDWAYDFTGRISFVPYSADDGARLIHVGSAYSYELRDEDSVGGDPDDIGPGTPLYDGLTTIRYAKDPESHIAKNYIDTGDIQASGAHLFGAELAGVLGAFSAQAEFAGSLVDTNASGNEFLWGYYVQASYMLTGEHRNYDRKKGAFTKLVPNKSFAPGRGDWGAFELAAQFTSLDMDSGSIQAGEIFTILGGVNWYLATHFRVMANYIYSKLEDDGFGNIYQMRFQVDF